MTRKGRAPKRRIARRCGRTGRPLSAPPLLSRDNAALEHLETRALLPEAAHSPGSPPLRARCESPARRRSLTRLHLATSETHRRLGRRSLSQDSPAPRLPEIAGTLTRLSPPSRVHLLPETGGLTAPRAKDLLFASSVHLLLAGRVRSPANGCPLARVAEGSKLPPMGRPTAIHAWPLAPRSRSLWRRDRAGRSCRSRSIGATRRCTVPYPRDNEGRSRTGRPHGPRKSPFAQPALPPAPIGVGCRSESPALPGKEEPVRARFWLTPTAALDEARQHVASRSSLPQPPGKAALSR